MLADLEKAYDHIPPSKQDELVPPKIGKDDDIAILKSLFPYNMLKILSKSN